jgi:hypothetical protein
MDGDQSRIATVEELNLVGGISADGVSTESLSGANLNKAV